MKSHQSRNFAFIFDLDGTLVNSFPQILKCLNLTSLELSLPPIKQEIIWELFGQPLHQIVLANGIPKHKTNLYIEKFRLNLKNEIISKNEVYSGVSDLLSKISQVEVKLGIATSKPTDLAKLVWANSELSNYPFAIKGSEQIPPKPDPTVILEVMRELEVSKGIMIGDRIEDIIAGKAAGLHTCAVLQSAHHIEDFKLVNPDFLFETMEELNENFQIFLGLVEQ